ncbi:hypothetical protein BFINE_44170 [Bacteroides finegoldii DSM 17565]|nr:hypothetical protein BFINE_44170 [Bacteroides finegoldii DSM 17565]
MKIIVFFLCLTLGVNFLSAQDIERNVKERLTDYFGRYTTTAKISTPKLKSVDIDYERKTIAIHASESFAYQPFRPETVEAVYNQVKELLPDLSTTIDSLSLQMESPLRNLSRIFIGTRKRIRNGCP